MEPGDAAGAPATRLSVASFDRLMTAPGFKILERARWLDEPRGHAAARHPARRGARLASLRETQSGLAPVEECETGPLGPAMGQESIPTRKELAVILNTIEPEFFIPFLIFAVPIIAIVGGITAGIVRTLGRQRLVELAHRERIAAMERGIDPAKLPPLPELSLGDSELYGGSWVQRAKHRAQGLMVGGVITTFAGAGLAAFLLILRPDGGEPVWAVGLIPLFVGAALLLSAWLVWPRNGQQPSAPGS